MTLAQAVALLLAIAAAAGYVNHRWLRLPATIGLMALAMLASMVIMAFDAFTPIQVRDAIGFVARVDFRGLLLDGMLPFLLFAGALHVDIGRLRDVQLPIAVLDTAGVALATGICGTLFFYAAQVCGFELSLLQAMLFGALIAPTDPIAVLGILRSAGAPARLEALMAGESLFNDGVGIVLFLALFGAALNAESLSALHLAHAFLLEGTGGLALGGALGWAVSRLLRGVDDYPIEIFLTLALAATAYTLAATLGLSGPLAVVAAGLIVGSHGRDTGMSQRTQAQLDGFWIVVDQMLSAVLFLLVGLEMLLIPHDRWHLLLGALTVPAVLFARWASVAACLTAIRRWCRLDPGTVTVLTWGGLRGGISIALALSLPPGALRETIVTTTYIVVAFSVLGQGLTLSRLARAVIGKQ